LAFYLDNSIEYLKAADRMDEILRIREINGADDKTCK
jgi:hypothetical protein